MLIDKNVLIMHEYTMMVLWFTSLLGTVIKFKLYNLRLVSSNKLNLIDTSIL